jgi:hypothetical protein
MMTPNFIEAWLTLLAEALKGTGEAQEAFRTLNTMSGDPEALRRWLAKFLPAGGATQPKLQPEAFESWLEESWRMMGLVPRARYLELLEKNDLLQRRLEKAEETIKSLQAMLDSQDPTPAEAQKVMKLWGSMLEDTLKLQAEWLQSWGGSQSEAAESGPESEPADRANDGEKV